METLLHADIFFLVTTVLVVVLVLLAAVVTFYAIKISRSVLSITETVRREGENVIEDIAAFREKMKEDSRNMKGFGGIVRKVMMGASFFRKAASSVKRKARKEDEDEE